MQVVVLGRTGAGKTSAVSKAIEILKSNGLDAGFTVSATTREPRDGEKSKNEYVFVTDEEFSKMDFVATIEPGGWVKYGVLKDQGSDEKISFFTPISMQYALDVYNGFGGTNAELFVIDIDRKTREQRIRDRGETEEMIKKRFAVEDSEGGYDLSRMERAIVISDSSLSPKEIGDIIAKRVIDKFAQQNVNIPSAKEMKDMPLVSPEENIHKVKP